MAIRKVKTYTGVSANGPTSGATAWIPLNLECDSFALRLLVEKAGTGDVSYKVQGTIDNVFKVTTPVAFDLVSAQTGNYDGGFSTPLTAVRLLPVTVSGAVNLIFHIAQTGW